MDFTAKIISIKYNKSSILCITGDSYIEATCLSLQQKQENKKKTRKYKVEHSCLSLEECCSCSSCYAFRYVLSFLDWLAHSGKIHKSMFSAWSNLCLQNMLKTRTALPISEVKNDILQHLKERDVLVVCGETGSGKTTQVLSCCSLLFGVYSLIALFRDFF